MQEPIVTDRDIRQIAHNIDVAINVHDYALASRLAFGLRTDMDERIAIKAGKR